MGKRVICSIAVKNILRHPGKNFLLGVMVFLSTSVFLFTASITDNSRKSWRLFFSETTTGYVNVGTFGGKGRDMTSPDFDFPKSVISKELTDYLRNNNIPHTERIRLGGIKYNFEKQKFDGENDTCNIIGSDFPSEMKNLKNLKISEGSYDPDVPNGAVVWRKIMTRFNLKIGDEISYFINDSSGMPMPYTFIITGVCENIGGNNLEVEADNTSNPLVFVKYDFLAEKLGLENGEYTEAAIWPSSVSQISNIKNISTKYGADFYYADEAYEIITGITDFISFLGKFIAALIIIIFIVAAFNINIIGFIDRQKEIATMLSIGSSPLWIISLLFLEMIIFSLSAFILSAALYGLSGIVMHSGISFGELGILFSDKNFFFTVIPQALIVSFACVCAAMALSAVYPAYLTLKMNPAEVFREGDL
ncbi:MAG: ABC transporter permease [Spirochaetes bacterium]|nr:ABC transporter permease [Spirochaetota bacterium]